eukprot:6213138-Pleurochrysis_carterae.AAC.9
MAELNRAWRLGGVHFFPWCYLFEKCFGLAANVYRVSSTSRQGRAPSQIIDLVALACTRAASSLSNDDVCATGGCVCHASPCGRAAPESRDAMSGERPVSARPHDEARRADGTASPRRVPPRFVRPAHAEQATVNSTYAPRRPPQRSAHAVAISVESRVRTFRQS